MKTRGPASPRSTRAGSPSHDALKARTGSRMSRPRSRAKWLRVPAGTTTNGRSASAATAATAATVPSPPATPRTCAPSWRASLASDAASWSALINLTRAPIPSARSARRKRVAMPPPDRALTTTTLRIPAASMTAITTPPSLSRPAAEQSSGWLAAGRHRPPRRRWRPRAAARPRGPPGCFPGGPTARLRARARAYGGPGGPPYVAPARSDDGYLPSIRCILVISADCEVTIDFAILRHGP